MVDRYHRVESRLGGGQSAGARHVLLGQGRADDAVERVEQRLTMQLNKTERDQLLSLLGTCTANLEAAEAAKTG